MSNDMNIWEVVEDLFPITRSLSGKGNVETLEYIGKKLVPNLMQKSIPSGTEVYDWTVPPEWNINDAYVKNANGKKIIDFSENNLHVASYSTPFKGVVTEETLLEHLHVLDKHPSWIPYRTTYYSKTWGLCASKDILSSDDFCEPFEVCIDSEFNEKGSLVYGEALKKGETDEEILISTYLCHPSLANDNLSGLVTACFLFNYLSNIETRYSYRLVIVPETIGAICFLSSANTDKIVGGTVITCTGGPDKFSIKEGFDNSHWVNVASHLALSEFTNGDYITYPFVPDGSDERQYSSPAFRIVTPSVHKSKYYEYEQYHTSADNLEFISNSALELSLEFYKYWVSIIDSYCAPKRVQPACEYQLGKFNLYPPIGGTINQSAHNENDKGFSQRVFNFNSEITVQGYHLEAFHWLMHLADGDNSNFDIALKSNLPLSVINEAIALFHQKGLVKLR